MDKNSSDKETSRRELPSLIVRRPPPVQNPLTRPHSQKGHNITEQLQEDSEETELVQVYLRIKPCDVASNLYEVKSEKTLLTSLDGSTTAGHGRHHNVSRMYTFSRIFTADSKQKEVFEQVVEENLKKLPDGHSFTLLTYGASGSGKTYTLMGTVSSPGLVPRSLEYLFKLVDGAQMPTYKPSDTGIVRISLAQQESELQLVKRLRHVSAPLRDKYRRMSVQLHGDHTSSNVDHSNRTKHYIWVSFLEIYNENIYDLLAPLDKRTKLRIREDTFGNVYVQGVTQAFVRSGEEAYDVMVAGKHNLVVAATGIHARSSRSHCIFTITVLTENEGGVAAAHVHLCDLAGLERQHAVKNAGTRLQESCAINFSLHVLERCLHALHRKQRAGDQPSVIPYRESKVTRLLGSGLSGSRGEAVIMMVTLNPSPRYAHESKHVLSLAAVARDIQISNTTYASTLPSLGSKTQDTTTCSNAEMMKLRSDNERLRFELVQTQARNAELISSMAETQQQNANTAQELLVEAKLTMQQYYEEKLEDFKVEVAKLKMVIKVLEDDLSDEKLARVRAEKDLQHLRNCIEEPDEKASKDTLLQNVNEIILIDSDSDDENDALNESLEPAFKKGFARILHKKHVPEGVETSKNVQAGAIDNITEQIEQTLVFGCDSDAAKTIETLKPTNDSLHATGDDDSDAIYPGRTSLSKHE